MPETVRGPFVSNGFPGQVLVMDLDGSNRTAWTDAANLDLGGGTTPPPPELPFEVLTANKVLYVSQTGSDSNDGSQAAPFLTIKKAIEAAGLIYVGKYRVDINVAAGTWFADEGWILPDYNPAQINYPGSTLRPFNLITTGTAILQFENIGQSGGDVLSVNGAWRVNGFTIRVGPEQRGVVFGAQANLSLGMTWFENAGGGAAIAIEGDGGELYNVGSLTFSGPLWKSVFKLTNALAKMSGASTVNDNPTIGPGAFMEAGLRSTAIISTVFGGPATGLKFKGTDLSIIYSGTDLPGSLPGTLVGGSLYNGSETPPVTMSVRKK